MGQAHPPNPCFSLFFVLFFCFFLPLVRGRESVFSLLFGEEGEQGYPTSTARAGPG